MAEVCGGLQAAHELRMIDGQPAGVVHRDVSPHNILVSTKGVAKLIDFGLAKARDRMSEETSAGIVKGKLRYMAPEQVVGPSVDCRADVWAVGASLYHLLAGQPPYEADSDADVVRALMSGKPPPRLPARSCTPPWRRSYFDPSPGRWTSASGPRASSSGRSSRRPGRRGSTSSVSDVGVLPRRAPRRSRREAPGGHRLRDEGRRGARRDAASGSRQRLQPRGGRQREALSSRPLRHSRDRHKDAVPPMPSVPALPPMRMPSPPPPPPSSASPASLSNRLLLVPQSAPPPGGELGARSPPSSSASPCWRASVWRSSGCARRTTCPRPWRRPRGLRARRGPRRAVRRPRARMPWVCHRPPEVLRRPTPRSA